MEAVTLKNIEKRLATLEESFAKLSKQIDKKNLKPTKEKSSRPPSEYNVFIKKKYEEIKKENPDIQHKEIFAMCIAAWNERNN